MGEPDHLTLHPQLVAQQVGEDSHLGPQDDSHLGSQNNVNSGPQDNSHLGSQTNLHSGPQDNSHLGSQDTSHLSSQENSHQGPQESLHQEQSPLGNTYSVTPPLNVGAVSVIPIQPGFQEQVHALSEPPGPVLPASDLVLEKALPVLEIHEKGYHGLENHERAYALGEERPYNEQNWLVVGLGHVCNLEGCKYVAENNVSRRMHRHCLQLTSTGAKCTYNTERTSNLPGHDRVHMKGEPERDDAGNCVQMHDGTKLRKGVKRKAERVLNEDQQTPFAELGATEEQVGDLQRKGIQFVEDCRLYKPKEIKDCLLGSPREERRETEARQLLVKADTFLRKSGCWIGDLDLGFSDV